MKLVLVINNTSTLENGSKATATFYKAGGNIGSGAQCHWQLLDRYNSVACEHVRVFFQDGMYCAEAVSGEGILVNGSNRPIPAGQRFRISDGDIWKVGAFKLTTYLVAEGSELEGHNEQWSGRFAAIDTIVPGRLTDEDEYSQSNIEYILADRLESDLSEEFSQVINAQRRFFVILLKFLINKTKKGCLEIRILCLNLIMTVSPSSKSAIWIF